jgi:enamine deaminase RidA (YjgF/YER057c/UK114 family)
MRNVTFTVVLVLFAWAAPFTAETKPAKVIGPNATTGIAQAVVLDDVTLIQTTQLLPVDGRGHLVNGGDARKQAQHLVNNLGKLLEEAGSGLQHLVRANLYAARQEYLDELRRQLARSIKGHTFPVVTAVVTVLPLTEAAVAVDVLAIVPGAKAEEGVAYKQLLTQPGQQASLAQAAVLPAGPKAYVSGQYVKGNFEEATQKTIESLESTLRFLGLGWKDVVQLKTFLNPMSRASEARQIIASHIKGQATPPMCFVEWGPGLPLEIEVVASGNRLPEQFRSDESVSYLTPPGVDSSSVFSRIALIHGGRSVYVSGIYGDSSDNPEKEVRDIFAQLRDILREAGSDFNHMVKATYYVTNDVSSRLLGTIREELYNPRRPPAASKALVKGVGKNGHSLMLDMIAATPK